MAKIDSETKELVNELSKKQLVEIVLKLASKKNNYEFLLINYLDKENGEQTLYNMAIVDIEKLLNKEYNGRTFQHRAVKKLSASIKRIDNFVLNTNDKKLHANLMLFVLEHQLSQPSTVFGARFSGYDYKVGLLLKKVINLITKKMHSDYLLDYEDKINELLHKLHSTSNHIKTIAELPIKIEQA